MSWECHECLTCQRGAGSFSAPLGRAARAFRMVVALLRRPRNNGAVFSWITVASSALSSHWSALPLHSSRQEAVTNRNDIFSQSGGILYRGDSFSKSLSSMKPVLSSFRGKRSFHTHMSVGTMNWKLFMLSWVSNLDGNLLGIQWPAMTHSLSSQ